MPQEMVGQRRVVHTVGSKTQTVRICTDANQEGVYEDGFSLAASEDISLDDLAAQPDLAALRAWLVEHGGQPLTTNGYPGARLPALIPPPAAKDPWVVEAKASVDRVLIRVVDSFRQDPYRHRVEHSLHAELWSMLKQEPLLAGDHLLSDGRTRTQLVHKEWPETIPRARPDGNPGPRGLFDLAVLCPDQVRAADVSQLSFGRIAAPIVIEVGLNYGLEHLSDDANKLRNSQVCAPYLLHLSRVSDKDAAAVERLLCAIGDQSMRTAYVHLTPSGPEPRWKYPHKTSIAQAAPIEPTRRS